MADPTPPDLTSRMSQLHLAEKSCISLEKATENYVVHLAAQSSAEFGSSTKAAASATNNTVRLFSRETLAYISTVEGHEKTITGLKFHNHQLYTCSMDGTVRCWDVRKPGECVHKFEGYNGEQRFRSLDLNCDGRILCAGTEQADEEVQIVFWDVRKTEQLGVYGDCHQNDIEQLCFHPTRADSLVSGSMDGLVCVYDISQPCEDDAVLTALNVESSVSQVGWCGPDLNNIYSITHNKSLHIWDSVEFDEVVELRDINTVTSGKQNIDYLVDCFHSNQELFLLAGSIRGQMWVYKVEDKAVSLHLSLEGGHTDIVRCLTWDQQTQTLVTGGEDSMLCLWRPQQASQSGLKDSLKSSPCNKSKGKSRSPHAKPYKCSR